MAGADHSSSQESPPEAFVIIKFKKLPRRQVTLLTVTLLLNILLWSALATIITSIYLIAVDPADSTNLASAILTLTSSLASIGYIFLHTIFSLKQSIWRHQRRHPSIIEKTSYFAIRLAVTLCVLWLLTSGWNFITVARQPICLPREGNPPGWQVGTTCAVGRVGIAFSMVALLASCTLFGMLSVVRRPFEAHVFKHGYRPPAEPQTTPAASRRPSLRRSASSLSEKFRRRFSSSSTRRSTPSNDSHTNANSLDWRACPPPATIHAPSPIRSIGMGMFTSDVQPPPLPAYIPRRSSSTEPRSPVFYPSSSLNPLPGPPRMSSLIAPSGFVPLSIPIQYSASAWRAVHPPLPSPLGPAASRSNPHLPHPQQGNGYPYRNRYSRSSISLTRPHRLSSTTPAGSVAWSSRSGSTGPDEGRGSPASGDTNLNNMVSANAIAYAILNGAQGPARQPRRQQKSGHIRRASAPDTAAGAQSDRKAMGWKPRLQNPEELGAGKSQPSKIIRSSSAELLSRFSPDSSPDGTEISIRKELERELDLRLSHPSGLPFRKTRSASPLRHSDIPGGAANLDRATTVVSRMPQDPMSRKGRESGTVGVGEKRRMTFDELKNKPLPKIAML
ncbi:hypothetical protein BCR34DRAFT_528201 [Clohesyomyces aquaticus]|uniref:Uncharacterized protein n=1 Tax=Clohesyomyces aquaticus TaxID=1231657 RepID=A0A1Y2A9U9_9PLEO|nr:hypothetical protein BCR34DRAFT_528201 [Clohesyomyces aquaticus]